MRHLFLLLLLSGCMSSPMQVGEETLSTEPQFLETSVTFSPSKGPSDAISNVYVLYCNLFDSASRLYGDGTRLYNQILAIHPPKLASDDPVSALTAPHFVVQPRDLTLDYGTVPQSPTVDEVPEQIHGTSDDEHVSRRSMSRPSVCVWTTRTNPTEGHGAIGTQALDSLGDVAFDLYVNPTDKEPFSDKRPIFEWCTPSGSTYRQVGWPGLKEFAKRWEESQTSVALPILPLLPSVAPVHSLSVGFHSHKCPKCGRVRQHSAASQGNRAAHTCPSCGTVQWDKHQW